MSELGSESYVVFKGGIYLLIYVFVLFFVDFYIIVNCILLGWI